MESFKVFSNEIDMDLIHALTRGRNIGIVTATHPAFPASENRCRDKQLALEIRKHGYSYVKIKTRYLAVFDAGEAPIQDEEVYLVLGHRTKDNGMLKRFLISQGKEYDQDSIVFRAHDEQYAKLRRYKGTWVSRPRSGAGSRTLALSTPASSQAEI